MCYIFVTCTPAAKVSNHILGARSRNRKESNDSRQGIDSSLNAFTSWGAAGNAYCGPLRHIDTCFLSGDVFDGIHANFRSESTNSPAKMKLRSKQYALVTRVCPFRYEAAPSILEWHPGSSMTITELCEHATFNGRLRNYHRRSDSSLLKIYI